MSLLKLRDFAKDIGVDSPTTFPKRPLILKIMECAGISYDPETLPAPPKRRGGRRKKDRSSEESLETASSVCEEETEENEEEDILNNKEETVVSSAVDEDILAGTEWKKCEGVLEIQSTGNGFLRTHNYLAGNHDIYVAHSQIRRFGLLKGDRITGKARKVAEPGKLAPGLLCVDLINGDPPEIAAKRKVFDDMMPIFPDTRYTMEREDNEDDLALRCIDLIAPIGKGQRALIVAPPKAGKTILLKKLANSLSMKYPKTELIVLLIDERPEEVTDMQRSITGEVVYSTFDETPQHHTQVAEMVFAHAQRMVEQGKDVVILMDSITRLARAYNMTITPTGRTLSGGLDPGALHLPKRFFGAARNIEGGGSLTIIATALVETGSRMDDIVYEEFKGTGNMEIHLDRKLSEKRIFPAIDLNKSGTRREDLLLTPDELECSLSVRKLLSSANTSDATDQLLSMMAKTRDNIMFIKNMKEWVRAFEGKGYTFGGGSQK